MLNDHGALDAAAIAFFAIFLVLAICNLVFVPRGYHREYTGWICIAAFCLIKITGNALTIHIQLTNSTSTSLLSVAGIFTNIALSPLLSAAIAFANNATNALPTPYPLFQRFMRLLQILLLVALILGVVAGTDIASAAPDSSDANNAVTLLLASCALFMVAWSFLTLATVFLLHSLHAAGNARTLIKAVALALPFLLVRVIYSLLVATHTSRANPSGTYNRFSAAGGELGWTLVMGFLMELGVVAILTTAGVSLHRFEKRREGELEKGMPGQAVELRG
ncbi:hypothetical protein EDC01DRAFT_62671 [Geopyxis carbonaria]|nr:hypothetical protein EDC01DRAFT_62671 [Geopyxis carbonaria]